MGKLGTLGARLHHGEVGYDFVKNRKLWYGISILITITAIVGLAVRGLHMGIEFQGGAVFTTPKNMSASVSQAETYAEEASGHDAIVQKLGDGSLRIQISGTDTAASDQIKEDLSKDLDVPAEKINADLVGPSWGDQIANKAWQGLGIFMVLVVIYLAIAFEWRMALAAFVALVHDITITVGIYALVGFEVTPGTVIGLLTILGYSLYDTVVVFDSLKEQTRDITNRPAGPTPRSPTGRSTAPWSAPSTPPWSRCCRWAACCSSAAVSSGRACSTTSPCRCSSASRPVPTRRSSSPRRSSPTSRRPSRR